MKGRTTSSKLGTLACAVVVLATISASAQTYKILHAFRFPEGAFDPGAGLVRDGSGNLYGNSPISIWQLTPDSSVNVRLSYSAGQGHSASAIDGAGNIYGTAEGVGRAPYGLVFELTPDGRQKILYTFGPAPDGSEPAGLIRDSAGNLYGVTYYGGAFDQGTVWKINAADGSYEILHNFTGGSDDGGQPNRIVVDGSGNIYGTAGAGGALNYGIVYKLGADGQLTNLHNFSEGERLPGAMLLDGQGNLYGTTGACTGTSCGELFRIDAVGNYTVVLTFGVALGNGPALSLVEDRSGNLYGVTYTGGVSSDCAFCSGVLFKIAPDGTASALHTFHGGSDDGYFPVSLILSHGVLYGTTYQGGKFFIGTVFQYTLQ